ncbi:uncharacterized protein DS421_11g327840 [Arachis hypogaea]|nr:uncharacterized protein DS421_11g327840 [Arachis hypogaea]
MSMMGGGSTAGGSSVRSPSSWNRTRTQMKSRRSVPPEWCGCGCRPIFRCGKRWCGLFVWADYVNEEQVDKSESCSDDYEVKMNFDWRLQRLEEDVHMQKVITQLFPVSNRC